MSRGKAQGKAGEQDNEQAILVAGDFAVLHERRLPALDSPFGEAYEARDIRLPNERLYAMRCRRELPPRLDVVRALTRVDVLPMALPRAADTVPWPDDGREHYVVVLRRPGGPRVLEATGGEVPHLREDELRRCLLPNMLTTLSELRHRQICHRAIRVENLFYVDESRREMMLGECVSEPTGYSQPPLYEPVSSAMAMPTGRATGGPPDDIYALGVLLVVLLNGGDPCAGMADEQVVASKILHGTYGTLVRKARISLSLMEPLRGMLCDDPAKRWTAEDIGLWLNGRHQVPKSHTLPPKVPRTFEFKGQVYQHLETLAHAMAHNWDEAVEPLADGRVMGWIRKCYGNDVSRGEFLDQLDQLLGVHRGPNSEDERLASLLMAFDPQAPIRFRSIAVEPEALGRVLALGYQDSALTEDFKAILKAALPVIWLRCQPSMRPEYVHFGRAIETVRNLLDRDGYGYGLERCLYELNEAIPCRSPLLDRFLVSGVDQVLPALERLGAEEPYDQLPVDRHIAAFCAAQVKELPKQSLNELSAPEESPEHRIGILRLLSTIHRVCGGGPYRSLARWVLRGLSPAITDYHHRPYRQKLAQRLQALAEEGALTEMLMLLDNEAAQQRDELGFKRARALHDRAVREVAWLREGGLTSPKQIRKGSQQAALLISSVISGCALLVMTLLYVG